MNEIILKIFTYVFFPTLVRCLAKELYVHYGSKKVRKIRFDEHPLQLQHHFLQELGHSNLYHMQQEGLQENLSMLIKFVAGKGLYRFWLKFEYFKVSFVRLLVMCWPLWSVSSFSYSGLNNNNYMMHLLSFFLTANSIIKT